MTDNKKKWVKPELIILVRSNPAEAVIGCCKTGTWAIGPQKNYYECGSEVGGGHDDNCVACQGWAAS